MLITFRTIMRHTLPHTHTHLYAALKVENSVKEILFSPRLLWSP